MEIDGGKSWATTRWLGHVLIVRSDRACPVQYM